MNEHICRLNADPDDTSQQPHHGLWPALALRLLAGGAVSAEAGAAVGSAGGAVSVKADAAVGSAGGAVAVRRAEYSLIPWPGPQVPSLKPSTDSIKSCRHRRKYCSAALSGGVSLWEH